MKVWVRVVVTISVIIVLGFTVWAFFFREKDEVQAYNKTSELIDYRESLGIEDLFNQLEKLNYCGGETSNIINSESDAGKSIYSLRELILSSEDIINSTSGATEFAYDSYRTLDDYVGQILEYLLPFTKSDRVHTKSLSDLKKNIKSYIESLQDMKVSINGVMDFQNRIDGSDLEALNGRYLALRTKYRTNLEISSKLILSMLDFIDKSVYSDNFYFDTNVAMIDAFARSLRKSTIVTIDQEDDYLIDVYVVTCRFKDLKNGVSIFNEEFTEYKFTSSYNLLFNSYMSELVKVFDSKNQAKKQMTAGTNVSNTALSNIQVGAQEAVVVVLNVLGYAGV